MKSWIACFLLIGFAVADLTAEESVATSQGEFVYVPIYSSVFFSDGKRTIELTAMLSIHNVNRTEAIMVDQVDYHDTKGKLIKKYLEAPVELAPLETRNFVVERTDTSGGTGANFLVGWRSKTDSVSPIVEALMINVSSGQGISFTSAGKVIEVRKSE